MRKRNSDEQEKKPRKIRDFFYKLPIIISLGCVIFGLVMMSLPVIGQICTDINNSSTIDEYQESLAQMTDEEIEQAKEDAKSYNDKNKGNYDALNLGEVISYIDIPKINVYIPIYNNTEEDTLQKGVGHLEHTSLPIGGKGTHCVLTGHSGLENNRMFTDLEKLEIGDTFKLHTLNEVLTYQVDEINVALPDDAVKYISQDWVNDYCTLITCTPIGINTHRLLVRGTHISTETVDVKSQNGADGEVGDTRADEAQEGAENENAELIDLILNNWFWWLLIFLFICGSVVSAIVVKKKEKNQEIERK